jgi:hypothetical protein
MCRHIRVKYCGIRLECGSRPRLTVVSQQIAQHADDLAVFADYLRVKSLECFLGQRSVQRKRTRRGGPSREPQWHWPADGLRTVRSLLRYLSCYPRSDGYYKQVRTELALFERTLERAERQGVRWHLVAWSAPYYFCRGGRRSRDFPPVRVVAATTYHGVFLGVRSPVRPTRRAGDGAGIPAFQALTAIPPASLLN